jgi:cyclophilin family peptidyl-prolyl cis-trans isomerase
MITRFIVMLALVSLIGARLLKGGTLADFQTTLGNMQLELFDDDKPVTVSNFVKYVTSGRFANQFIQRWEAGFVIQAGGFTVSNTPSGPAVAAVPTFGAIKNEYSVGPKLSNTYGTIAMARQGGVTNSATSQWFINLGDNSFLDQVDGGFTVFGKLTGGTNVLNLFVPAPPVSTNLLPNANGIYQVPAGGALSELPALNANPGYGDLIYIDIKLSRDVSLQVSPTRPGQRSISWKTVAGVTNSLQYSSALTPGTWTIYTNIVGNGAAYSLIDSSADKERVYRVTLTY